MLEISHTFISFLFSRMNKKVYSLVVGAAVALFLGYRVWKHGMETFQDPLTLVVLGAFLVNIIVVTLIIGGIRRFLARRKQQHSSSH